MRFLTPFRSYRTKLQAAFVGLALLAISVTGWEAGYGASTALREATFDRLTVIRQTRARQIERYFEDVANHVLALAADQSAVTALEELERAWPHLSAPPAALQALEVHYRSRQDWLPADPRARALQYHYIVANPHPVGAKDRLLTAPAAGAYGLVHARFHPTLHRYQSAFGFYDIFLISPAGRILYTVFKEIDLGASLTSPQYNGTALAKAHRRAMALPESEITVLEDYAEYTPSHGAPAAFVAAPVWRGGEKAGVLAIQISIHEVNRVMTGSGHWREEGFGDTGQAFMVDSANVLRSDLRANTGGTAVLRPNPGESVTGAGTGVSSDGKRLRSWAPLSVPDVQWSLVAEIDAAEGLAPVGALQRRIAAYGLLIAAGFFFIAQWLAQGVTAPVLALAENARRLGSRDFQARIALNRNDEIGELAASFNRMAEDLEQTTVSKQAVDHILASMLNAVFVAENGLITRANPAAEELLGYAPGALIGVPVPATKAPIGRPAVETELARKDGAKVPVLLAAARLDSPDAIVYAAQDISDLRRLSGRLIAAQEDERRRIARELHDDFSQRLAAAAIAAGQGRIEPVRRQLALLAEELHALSRRLHPSMLDDLGLEAAIAAECRASFERGGPPVDFAVEGPLPDSGPDVDLALYRIVQEGLRNIARHANAQQVTVRLRPSELEISDDGQGFDPNGPGFHPGLGLASMEERTRLLGGQWSLVTAPAQGVKITIRLKQ
ncbi:MAG: HAMP domain-containing protein [Bryobacteraceae bacterium]